MNSLTRAWCLLVLLAAPGLAIAQNSRPAHAGRIVRQFDFEEPVVGTIRLPRHWVRAQHDPLVPRDRPGFPIWNAAELDDTVAFSGDVSVRVPVEGGSASLRLDPGVIPVFPGADYLIAAKVRTKGAVGSRARLNARFLNAASSAIPASEQSSRLVNTYGEWTAIGVTLFGDFDNAAFIQIDLDLVQTREYVPARLGEHQVFHDDHEATAWFDDVIVMQLPRVELGTPAPFNMFVESESPTILINVRDLTGKALHGVLRVIDDRGVEIDRLERDVPPGRFKDDWTPTLSRLGWYRAILELRQDGALVGATHLDFAWILDTSEITDGQPTLLSTSRGAGRLGGGSIDRERFGIDVHQLDGGLLTSLPDLMKRIGAGAVTIPAWSAETSELTIDDRATALSRLVSALSHDWVRVTLAFSRVPDELIEIVRVRADDPMELITGTDPDIWRPYTIPILDQLGPRVSRWQIGPTGDDAAFWARDLAGVVEPVNHLLLSMVTTPVVVTPWRADRALRDVESPVAGTDSAVSMLAPSSFGPEALERLGATIQAPENTLTLVLEPLDAEAFGPRATVDDLVKRTVMAWTAFDHSMLERISLSQPWRISDGRRPVIMPGPEAAAWRNVVERLAERRRIGRFPGLPGVHCEILDNTAEATPGRGGVLVAWREAGASEDTAIVAPLGEGDVRVIDVYGNEQIVSPTMRADGTEVHVVPVTASPVFIENVDVKMVRFVASFSVTPRLIPSTNDEHRVTMSLTNPWPMRITGKIFVVQPGGPPPGGGTPDRSWQVKPRVQRFSIEPGATQELPLAVAFSPYEEAGLRELVAEASVSAERELSSVRLVAPFEIGLDYLEMEASYRFVPTPQGPNVIIEATVTNTGDDDILAELRAYPPDLPRIKLPPVSIAPGQSIVRRFMIEDGVNLLRGKTVSVNASEVDRNGSLNRRITID